MRRRILTGLSLATGAAALGAALVPVAVTWIEKRQARANGPVLPYVPPNEPRARRVGVVVYSRSGNTALAARSVAQRLGAVLVSLQAARYELGLMGWARAMQDAREHEARVTPGAVDLSDFDVVWLGSPIWLYSPAPPIWEFARQHRFDGKEVVLFNTFNSKFEPRFIGDFRSLLMSQGARSFQHRSVKRGRMGQQLRADEMLDAIGKDWALPG